MRTLITPKGNGHHKSFHRQTIHFSQTHHTLHSFDSIVTNTNCHGHNDTFPKNNDDDEPNHEAAAYRTANCSRVNGFRNGCAGHVERGVGYGELFVFVCRRREFDGR